MSLLLFSKIAWASGVVAWFVMRLPFQRKARRQKVSDARHRTLRDMTLLSISTLGLGVVPAIYAATSFPRFAAYPTSVAQVAAIQRDWLAESEPLLADEWRQRPFRQRVVENIARLFDSLV